MTINLPERVEFILENLNCNGYAAYVVGGCVRDSVLGIKPHDWDICTSARPEETIRCFKELHFDVLETGVKYGTVTVIMKDERYPAEYFEITTFRIDGEYVDNRRPEDVTFTDDLVADLARRDFTINAMAYHPKYGLVDPFGGEEDIRKKLIRCVGEPEQRFGEDALRMIRAVRFALRYDYAIEERTLHAIKNMKQNISNVAVERVSSEITRILNETFFPDKSNDNSAIGLLSSFLCMFSFYRPPRVATALSFCNGDLETSLAVLCDEENIEEKLMLYRFPKHVAECVAEIRKVGTEILNDVEMQYATGREFRYLVRKMISKIKSQYPVYTAKCAVHYAMVYCAPELFPFLYRLEKQIDMILGDRVPYKVCQLDINGNDVMELGYNGKAVGEALNYLLDAVMDEYIKNEKEELISFLKANSDI